ncbi:MAG: neutral zinc metallopeptidase [Planctomycetales bacterium]|nr:neutral zinc metallopeptidase [Planctomycetales bacterium]
MRWEGREESANVEDRRGMRTPMMLGGGGLVTIIVVIIGLLLGQPPNQLLQDIEQQQAGAQLAADGDINPEEEAAASFVKVVLKDTEDVWNRILPQDLGKQYQEPILVLFSGSVDSACGQASAAVGPFYCPGDSKVYLDLSFFKELQDRFGAPGDFACAYVIAHEVGHHVQNLLGLSTQVQRLQQGTDKVEANHLSVRLELQADFLAGVWARHAQETKDILESGDLEEAIRAAQQIGDDTLMKKAAGRVVPDAFTHGTSEQRIRWFTHGLKTGDLTALDQLFELPYEKL